MLAIKGIDDFDPTTDGGNGEENPAQVKLATDGSPTTAWQTVTYLNDPALGKLKPGVGIVLDEMALPVDPQVAAACEFLGLDPLHIANEGKLIAICAADEADALVAALRAHPLGARAARVGEVCADERCFVQMKTALGGRRMVDWLAGEQLPRIC